MDKDAGAGEKALLQEIVEEDRQSEAESEIFGDATSITVSM